MSPSTQTRTERDSLGERELPDNVYYGIQTARAVENFPISGLKPFPSFVTATVQIKKAAARVNSALGALDPKIAGAIESAADEVLSGKLREQFVVDPFQAGAGTSHNMNANEVLANRGAELLGGKKGDYSSIHPNDHVNMGQSTNDVIPTAMRLAALDLVKALLESLDSLAGSFQDKASEFDHIVKSGRTHLQDAVPVRLGQEFGAYATAMRKNSGRIAQAADELRELGLGGTAAGTGLNAVPGYREGVVQELSRITGEPLRRTNDYFESMQSMSPFVLLSGALKTLATDLIRIANDLRLLSSGPNTGLGEIALPPVQPGSSIMPGKVNPVMAEMTGMVCFQVIGNDATIATAAQAGQLELNVMMPVIAFDLLMSLTILTNALNVLRERCVDDITANEERCRWYVENSVSLVTALNTRIGYAKAAEIAKRAIARGKTIRETITEESLLAPEEVADVLDTYAMTGHDDDPAKASDEK
ncbi:MAG TPA: aspartate ammonia-lyase [Blastocatellia bacterium]|jgi:aspartate ammonia-lyase|nr:aspartate ammonia-lyase [Blastocatellia bacterium]